MTSSNDILRQKVIESYDILDTPPEEMFDDITSIAASICNTPIALINILADDKQFFKSHLGLDINSTSLEHSICKHAIASDGVYFEVPDLSVDERFKENPYVSNDPSYRFYFGVPLTVHGGVTVGTLCVLGNKPKSLTEKQKNSLQKLSKQVVYLMELRSKNKLLELYQSKVEEYSKNMEEFSYTAAHDLKSPLRGIDSFLKLIIKKNEGQWDEKDKKYLNIMNESCERMKSLIEDLLSFARSGILEQDKEQIKLKDLVEEIFEGITSYSKNNFPILNVTHLPVISSYRVPITILFQNLMENALKYQPNDQTPELRISFSETLTTWTFEIKDNGIGIEEEYLERIFKPFKRLHNQTTYPGSGLGLAACKKIVQNLEGQIWVRSEVGNGSTFGFKIPK